MGKREVDEAMTKPKIVAIGGGELSLLETAAIDERIIELTGKARPKALFIPTASGDAPGYVDTFEKCYGDHFGCRTRVLKLVGGAPASTGCRRWCWIPIWSTSAAGTPTA